MRASEKPWEQDLACEILLKQSAEGINLPTARLVMMKLRDEMIAYAAAFVFAWPGMSGTKLRAFYLRRKFSALGREPIISSGVDVLGAENIRIGSCFSCGRGCAIYAHGGGAIAIGDQVSINANVTLNASVDGEIYIGNHVLIGPGVLMRATDHSFARTDLPISLQGHVPGTIKIEDGAWIGGNVTILGGVTIGQGAVVAAGAVVTRDVSPFSVVSGVPAKHLKWRENRPVPVSADGIRNK